MIYSNGCSYAIRALSWLALQKPDGYMLLDELCEKTSVPKHFVAKVFQDLVRSGLLVSARGRGGGFALARPAKDIRLIDIVEAVDGTRALHECVVGLARCDEKQPCPQHEQWKPLRDQIRKYLEQTTLERNSRTLHRKLQLIGADTPADALPNNTSLRRS